MQNDFPSGFASTLDEQFMQRCLFLAAKGLGATYPNPLVGCVIVHQGKIIGEGWHKKAGTPHAEVNAIEAVEDKKLLKTSTLYVNLEPCAHYGKTPPCADLILKYKIPKVVIGTRDPHDQVAGKGIEKLQKAGCDVVLNALEKEAAFLNRRFFCFHQKKRPYIILKWAQTEDHFLGPKPTAKTNGSVFWITGALAQQRVHQWRSEEQAIMVGVQTVIEDDPQLTTRHWEGKNPLRFVLDPNDRIPSQAKMLTDEFPTYLLNKEKKDSLSPQKTKKVTNFYSAKSILETLFKLNIQSVIIEGGAYTLNSFLKENLWDEIRLFQSTTKLEEGISAPEINLIPQNKEQLGEDQLFVYYAL